MNRRRFTLWVAGALWAVLVPLRAAEEALPKADSIMDRYIEVTGGKAVYEKRRSEIITIEMEIVGRGIKGTLTRYSDTSNNSITTGELEGAGKMEEGVYEGKAWENTAVMGPRVKSGEENADSVRDSYFNASLLWRNLYKAETLGVEKVNGDDCYKIQLTPIAGGKPQYDYISKKTGFIVRIERTMVNPMGEITVQASASDYKPFEGILYPTKIVQSVMGNQISLTMLALKVNEEIPKSRFEPPADVKKLMSK